LTYDKILKNEREAIGGVEPYSQSLDYVLYHGDCLDVMSRMPNESVDLIVTSPPYFNAKKYSAWNNYKEYLEWCDDWIRECLRILDVGRMFCIIVSSVIDARKARNKRSTRYNIPGDMHQILTKNGAWFAEDLIWEKPEGAAINRNQRFSLDRHPMQWRANPTTEHMLIYQKPSPYLNDSIIKEKSNGHRVQDDYERGEVWKICPVSSKEHPAPFPKTLPEKLIRYYSWPGEIVLDLFAGSGTTGIVCCELNRKCIMIEKWEKYCGVITKRLSLIPKEAGDLVC